MNAKKQLTDDAQEHISSFFKEMLVLLEDMKADHDFHYQKLYDNIPEEYHPIINTANHFNDAKKAWIRKRILDFGNDSIRNIQSNIEHYEVSFVFNNN